jgi:hypothetical protein
MARYIDLVSTYCDNWCERCAFTERCSHYAVTSALAMCEGNFEAALELAMGRPQQPGGKPQKSLRDRMAELFSDAEEPSQKELDEIGREMEARDERVRRHPLAEMSRDYAVAGRCWLQEHRRCAEDADAATREAVEVLQRDLFFIHAKIVRALDGKDEDPAGAFWKSAVQNDWNGSAKVSLISVDRSERAWRHVATTFRDEAAAVLADSLAHLRNGMNEQFPRAMEFLRPGFDDRAERE